MMRALAGMSFTIFVSAFAASPAFDIADVHVSPRSDWVKNAVHRMDGGVLGGDRYELHRATMLDLIRTAYNIDADKVFGGPSWLDYDRFEIIAKTKPGTRPATLRLMLQTLLADRFHLVVKVDMQPVPGYVLSIGKGNLKLKAAADGSHSTGCQNNPHPDAGVMYMNVQCQGITMADFAVFLRGSVSRLPVLDSTGLDGSWDIDLQYPSRNMAAAGTADANVVSEVEKLGLKLEPGKVPQPVLTVVSVDQQPSANPEGVTAALPSLPAPEFEVASVKLSGNEGGGTRPPRYEPGGRVVANGMPPGSLIAQAWNQVSYLQPVGTPKSWGDRSTTHNITIVAKAPAGIVPTQDNLNAMLRAMLIDRYQMTFHFEERPMDADTLVAVKPKLTKADPANRTGCTRQPQQRADGARTLRLVCQNMTMAQFAEQIQAYDSDMFYPALDGTGLDGAWDFTVEYDPLAAFAARGFRFGGGAATPAAEGQASDPSGSVSFSDAIQKQLGLKLEVHKRPEQVLVIDHMLEDPTEN